jgi:hypothetical protein
MIEKVAVLYMSSLKKSVGERVPEFRCQFFRLQSADYSLLTED